MNQRLAFPLALVSAVVLLLTLLLGQARQWNPALSHDTVVFYYPELAPLGGAVGPAFVLEPFWTPKPADRPTAAEAKPLFVAGLRLWSVAYRGMVNARLHFPDARAYSDFVSFSVLAAFLAVVWAGAQFGSAWAGLGAAVVTFFSPWALAACYFNTYTALSCVPLILCFALLMRERPSPTLAGLLGGASLWINPSGTVLLAGWMGVCAVPGLVFQPTRIWASTLVRFVLGLALAWLAIESIVAIGNLQSGWAFAPQFRVLAHYLGRASVERTEFFAIYAGSLFPRLLWMNNRVLTLVAAGLALFWGEWFLRRRGGASRVPTVRLLLGIVAALLMIDARQGPKFSRTYFLLLPFVNLFVAHACRDLWRAFPQHRRRLLAAAAIVGVFLIGEGVMRLKDQAQAFLRGRNVVAALTSAGVPVYVFAGDTYLPFFRQLLETVPSAEGRLQAVDGVCDSRGDPARYFLVSPNVHSLLNLPTGASGTRPLELPAARAAGAVLTGACSTGGGWRAESLDLMPFFSHYPFLVLEDPESTYAMLYEGRYGTSDYRDGIGRLTLWKVSETPSPRRSP